MPCCKSWYSGRKVKEVLADTMDESTDGEVIEARSLSSTSSWVFKPSPNDAQSDMRHSSTPFLAFFRLYSICERLASIRSKSLLVGKPGRNNSDKEAQRKDFEFAGFKVPENFWMFDQFITVGCFALTEYSKVKPSGEYNTEDCQWFDIDNLPELMYDHEEIIRLAVRYLPIFANYCPIGYNLLPEKFTLPEIQSLYETMLNKKLDSRNFAKRLTSLGIIIKLDEQRKIGAHRSPYLYKFNKERYDEVIKDVSSIII